MELETEGVVLPGSKVSCMVAAMTTVDVMIMDSCLSEHQHELWEIQHNKLNTICPEGFVYPLMPLPSFSAPSDPNGYTK